MSSTAVKLEGTVAIVGFPNVGKSTLVNRLTATRQAVVHETQGTTRDRKELVCEWNGRSFLLIDTGGVDIADPSPITKQIALQARAAIEEADLVLFVVDARAGVTPGDEELAQILREAKKNVLVLANKIDDPSQESLALEFHRLGFGEPFPISALHGSNTGDLLDEILDLLPGESSRTVEEDAIRVAILGRPNVGKSSLYNKLVGSERTIVSEVPGTTRDTIDTVIEHDGRTFQLIDTAGPAAQAQAAAGDRVLLGAARARGGRAGRRRARPDRRGGGDRRGRHHRRRGRAQGALRDADRALEVGHLGDHDRGRASRARAPAAAAPGLHHDLVADRPRRLAPARQGRGAVRPLRLARADGGAEQVHRAS